MRQREGSVRGNRGDWKGTVVGLLGLALALPLSAQTPIGDTTADRVLGQLDFSRGGANLVDGRGFANPRGVAIDRSVNPNRVYVADFLNHRVLAWRNADTWANGDTADVVIGQPDFASNAQNNGGLSGATLLFPRNLAVDAAGNLYVADTGNHRVLRYNTPLAPGADLLADLVLGQPDMSSNARNRGGATSASSLDSPRGIAVDGNANVYVTDSNNQRVLRYAPPLVSGMAASQVFGQPDMVSSARNNGGLGGSSLNAPFGLAVDSAGNLFVADALNNRVLQYNTPASTDNAADRVFGQGDMLSGVSATTATGMNFPTDVTLNPAGDQLYVADLSNNRVLRFALPAAGNGPAANLVLGQTDFTSGSDAASATRMRSPSQLAVDTAGNLYVAEDFNHRVTFFATPSSNGQAASRVLGQTNLNGRGVNLPEGQGFNVPTGVAVDTSVTPNRVYVADGVNNRVLAWRDATVFANGAGADVVIGQSDFNGTDADTANNRLRFPQGLAVDGAGNLYVADSANHRVLRFDTPLNAGGDQVADLVLGQPDFVSNGNSNAGNGMNLPFGLSLNASGQLHVADFLNDRVLIFQPPFSNGDAAAVVLALAGGARPLGIAIDANDNLYVSQSSQNNVLRFNAPVQNTTPVSATINTGQGPAGLAFDTFGHLYVVERFNNRLVQYENPLLAHNDLLPDLVFGSAGAPSAVTINTPAFVAVDGSGNVYLSDDGDHRVLEFARPLAADFGDAPDSYGTTQANNGARHRKGGPLLGLAVDLEDDGLPAATGAQGDDASAATDDEDGVTIGNLAIGETTGISVVSSAAANLNAWVDLNGDGDFGDAGEQLLTDVTTAAGQQTVNLIIPGSATTGASFARFRLSTAAGTGRLGIAADGEVEDYAVTLGSRPTLTTPANQTVAEDGVISNLAVTVADQDSGTAGLTLTATSGNTSLIPNANLVTGGSGANRTLTITPAADQNGGPATITLTVSDGNFSAQTSFALTVTPVNDPPTLNGIGNFALSEDAGPLTINLGGISAGPANEFENISLMAQSSNPAVVPVPSLNYTSPNSTGSLLLALAPDANGSATITLTVDDGQAANNQISRSFNVTVSPVNDPPTLDALVDISVLEDTGPHTVNLTGISNGPADEAGALQVSVSSSNPQLIPQPTLSYTSPAASGSLSFTPTPNLTGNSTIEVTVTDSEGAQRVRSFVVTVSNVDDAPRISAIADQQLAEDGLLGPIAFTVEDFDEAAPVRKRGTTGRKTLDDLQLSVSSSNPALVPADGVTFAGSGANRSFTLSPGADQNGQATVVITVTDPQGLSHSASFNLTVTPVPDAPVAQPLTITVRENDVFFGQLQGTDADGDAIFYGQSGPTRTGEVEVFTDGSFRYAASQPGARSDQFSFRVNDGQLNSAPAVVDVVIIGNSGPPAGGGSGGGGAGGVPPGPGTGGGGAARPTPTPTPTPAPTPPPIDDGADDSLENQVGDGNGDGRPDSEQPEVASFPDTGLASVDGNRRRTSLTVAIVDEPEIPGSPGTVLRNVRTLPRSAVIPAGTAIPAGVTLADEMLSFEVVGLQGTDTSRVEIILGAIGEVPDYSSYYKYGPRTPGGAPELYEFNFDGETGARFNRETRVLNGIPTEVLVMTLVFRDGLRGDADLAADGTITDPGVPAIVRPVDSGGGSSGQLGWGLLMLLALAGLGRRPLIRRRAA